MSEPWAPGWEEGEKRNLGLGGAGLAFAGLNPDRMRRRPHPLCSCHVLRPRSLGHLESWKGRGKSRVSQPPSLLHGFSGDGGTGRSFQGWLRGTGRAEQKFFVGTLILCSAILTCSLPVLNVYGRDIEKAPHRRLPTWILSGGWGALLAYLFFLSFLMLDG